jgi:hypothetical protein
MGSAEPVQARILALATPATAGRLVSSSPWKETTQATGAPGARELQDRIATEAITNGAEPAAVDARDRGQRVEPGPDSSAQKVGILPQRTDERERLFWAASDDAATIEIGGQRNVSEPG